MRVLWIGKAADGSDGGDEIYDQKLFASMPNNLIIDRVGVERASIKCQIAALLRGIPHARFRFASLKNIQSLQDLSAKYDAAVISLEALEVYAFALQCPKVLLLHNIHSNSLVQIYPRSIIASIGAWWSWRWERKLYGQQHNVVAVLSERDKRLLLGIAPDARVVIVPPGSPPPTPLSSNATLEKDLLISGSYAWRPKRRDVERFAENFHRHCVDLNVIVDRPLPRKAGFKLRAKLSDQTMADGNIRFGLIPDTFISGFKLKATYYIANNFICLTRCDISSEFDDIVDAKIFVRYLPRCQDVGSVISEFEGWDSDELRERFSAFKAACANRFRWDLSAGTLTAALAALREP
jgi:hypothetical protein